MDRYNFKIVEDKWQKFWIENNTFRSTKNNNKKLIAIILLIFYFMDCLDGHFARKYNMVTVFGDYFDHFVDILSLSLLYLILVSKINIPHSSTCLSYQAMDVTFLGAF